MSLYTDYLNEIETRKTEGLNPKPIDSGALVSELIEQIKDTGNAHREDSLKFFIYNTLPGTTSAAGQDERGGGRASPEEDQSKIARRFLPR